MGETSPNHEVIYIHLSAAQIDRREARGAKDRS